MDAMFPNMVSEHDWYPPWTIFSAAFSREKLFFSCYFPILPHSDFSPLSHFIFVIFLFLILEKTSIFSLFFHSVRFLPHLLLIFILFFLFRSIPFAILFSSRFVLFIFLIPISRVQILFLIFFVIRITILVRFSILFYRNSCFPQILGFCFVLLLFDWIDHSISRFGSISLISCWNSWLMNQWCIFWFVSLLIFLASDLLISVFGFWSSFHNRKLILRVWYGYGALGFTLEGVTLFAFWILQSFSGFYFCFHWSKLVDL